MVNDDDSDNSNDDDDDDDGIECPTREAMAANLTAGRVVGRVARITPEEWNAAPPRNNEDATASALATSMMATIAVGREGVVFSVRCRIDMWGGEGGYRGALSPSVS